MAKNGDTITFPNLPREIRDNIYSHCFEVNTLLGRNKVPAAIFRVNRQINAEAREMLLKQVVFVQVKVTHFSRAVRRALGNCSFLVKSMETQGHPVTSFRDCDMQLTISSDVQDSSDEGPLHIMLVGTKHIAIFAEHLWSLCLVENWKIVNDLSKLTFHFSTLGSDAWTCQRRASSILECFTKYWFFCGKVHIDGELPDSIVSSSINRMHGAIWASYQEFLEELGGWREASVWALTSTIYESSLHKLLAANAMADHVIAREAEYDLLGWPPRQDTLYERICTIARECAVACIGQAVETAWLLQTNTARQRQKCEHWQRKYASIAVSMLERSLEYIQYTKRPAKEEAEIYRYRF